MSIPVTARLDESVVEALDRAVEAGLAPTRGAAIARAVGDWISHHGEQAVADSYRRRYEESDTDNEILIDELAAFSIAACLANTER